MMRSSLLTIVLISSLATFSAGCRPSSTNIKLRKESQQLQARIQELETLRSGDLARIRALEATDDRPANVSNQLLARLYTAHGLSLGRLTGGYRDPGTAQSDTGVVVHAVPTDQDGQTLKAAGRFTVTVFDLGVPEKPLVAQRQFSLEESRAAWNGKAMLFNYVLRVPFQAKPAHPDLLVRVEFIDELTGRKIIAEKNVTVAL